MKIAIVQFYPARGNIEKNIETHLQWIKQAVIKKVDMVVFPELSITGYEPRLAQKLATTQDDNRMDCFQLISNESKITIAVGLPTRIDKNLFISMIIFRPDAERITYSKQYLYPTEVLIFKAGNYPLVLEFDKDIVAPAICYELSNKEHVEFAAKNNATVYVASVLNSVSGVDGDIQKLSAIAKNYKLTTLMANFIGNSGGYECAGKSSVWNEKGELIAQIGNQVEGMIVYDTSTKEVFSFR